MSISPFFGLDMALRALQAQQTGIDVTSHNVANANTDGYSRQNVTIVTTEPFAPAGMNRPASAGQIGTGAVASDVQRTHDQFLDTQWRAEAGSLSNATNRSDALEQVEVVLDEPQGVGLNNLFNEYYRVWNELSNDPSASALPVRTTVVQQTLSLTTAFNRVASQLSTIRTGQNSEIQTDVAEVNDITNQIYQLNGTIVQVELTGQHANDFRDRRDALMDRLSQLVQVSSTENPDGSIKVLMGSGQTLVDGVTARTDLTTAPNAANNGFVDVIYGSGSTPASLGASGIAGRPTARDALVPKYQAQLDTIASNLALAVNALHTSGFDVNGNPGQPFFTGPGDVLAGSASTDLVKNETLTASGIQVGNVSLSGVAAGSTFTLSPNGTTGVTLSGIVGGVPVTQSLALSDMTTAAGSPQVLNFNSFGVTITLTGSGASGTVANLINDLTNTSNDTIVAGYSAAGLTVNTAIQADPSLIAASNSASASGNNEVALAITHLRTSMNPPLAAGTPTSETAYNSLVAGLGTDNRTARNEVDTQESLVDLLQRRRQSLSGVSLDEEATNLLRYQRAYEAAARVLSTYDQILDKLINGTGTVGR